MLQCVAELQCVAVCCNVLQCAAVCCSVLLCVAVRCIVAVCFSVLSSRILYLFARVTLQHVASRCNTLQHAATHCNTLKDTARHCKTLQHAATLCNTLQHDAYQYFSSFFFFTFTRATVDQLDLILQRLVKLNHVLAGSLHT